MLSGWSLTVLCNQPINCTTLFRRTLAMQPAAEFYAFCSPAANYSYPVESALYSNLLHLFVCYQCAWKKHVHTLIVHRKAKACSSILHGCKAVKTHHIHGFLDDRCFYCMIMCRQPCVSARSTLPMPWCTDPCCWSMS